MGILQQARIFLYLKHGEMYLKTLREIFAKKDIIIPEFMKHIES